MSRVSICHPFLNGYSKCQSDSVPSAYCNTKCHNKNPDTLMKLLKSEIKLRDVEEIICTSISYNSTKNLYVLLNHGPTKLSHDSMFVFIFRELIQQSAWGTLMQLLEDKTRISISQNDIIKCFDIIIPMHRPEVHRLLLDRCIPMRWPKTKIQEIKSLQVRRTLGQKTSRFLMAIELFHRHLDPGGPWNRP